MRLADAFSIIVPRCSGRRPHPPVDADSNRGIVTTIVGSDVAGTHCRLEPLASPAAHRRHH